MDLVWEATEAAVTVSEAEAGVDIHQDPVTLPEVTETEDIHLAEEAEER